MSDSCFLIKLPARPIITYKLIRYKIHPASEHYIMNSYLAIRCARADEQELGRIISALLQVNTEYFLHFAIYIAFCGMGIYYYKQAYITYPKESSRSHDRTN